MAETTSVTQRLDHLGIVAGICQEIELAGQIDRMIGPTDRQVSVGEAVQAMVLHALGFVSRPRYLTPEFFTNKPLDRLLRSGLTAEMRNDDSLGRALSCTQPGPPKSSPRWLPTPCACGASSIVLSTWTPPRSVWRGKMRGQRSRGWCPSPTAIPGTGGRT